MSVRSRHSFWPMKVSGVFPPAASRRLGRDEDVDLGFEAVADVIDEGDLGLDVIEVAAVAVEEDLDGGLLQLVDVRRDGLAGRGRGGRQSQAQDQDQGQNEDGSGSGGSQHGRSLSWGRKGPGPRVDCWPGKQQVLCQKNGPRQRGRTQDGLVYIRPAVRNVYRIGGIRRNSRPRGGAGGSGRTGRRRPCRRGPACRRRPPSARPRRRSASCRCCRRDGAKAGRARRC